MTYFSQYIDSLNDVVEKAAAEREKEFDTLERAKRKMENAQKKFRAGYPDRVIAERGYEAAKREHKSNINKIRGAAEAETAALRQSLEAQAVKWAAADPEKLDQNTVFLLGSGAMRGADLIALADKHWNNPTMLKLIQGNAEKDLTDSKEARWLAQALAVFLAPETRLRVFDDAAYAVGLTVRDDKALSLGQLRLWRDELYRSLRGEMAQLDSFRMGGV